MQEAARTIGLQLHVLNAGTDPEIDTAFDAFARNSIPALVVAVDPFFVTCRDKLVAAATRHALPTMYSLREFAASGGLISYGVDLSDMYRQAGYAGRILKGIKPADLPVIQPTKIRVGHKSEDGQIAWSHTLVRIAFDRRRGDRMTCVTSVPGTFETSRDVRSMVAIGGKADITQPSLQGPLHCDHPE